MKFFFMLLIACVSASSFASAEDGCKNPKTAYDQTYCIAKLFLESDKELNEVYQELRAQLKDAQKKKLVTIQKEWINYRDTSCSQGGTINVQCNFNVNRTRAEYLRDRVRECKTGHCDDEKIASKNW